MPVYFAAIVPALLIAKGGHRTLFYLQIKLLEVKVVGSGYCVCTEAAFENAAAGCCVKPVKMAIYLYNSQLVYH